MKKHSFGVTSLLIILIVASYVSNSVAIRRKCDMDEDCELVEFCKCDKNDVCTCQRKAPAAKIVYGQCKKDQDCAKMCAPTCKPSCLINIGLCRCVSNSTAIGRKCDMDEDCELVEFCKCDKNDVCTCQLKAPAAKIVYGQCKKDHDCAKMCAPTCKPSCLINIGLCRCEC
ncbi:hypothetical protein V6N12_041983 [Hibiscus sabdariffa]|uniref:Uncharacterized protein n=1 Tax=Hibiscus sabdariffa TaxID=183260 RepID=A0ABR2EDF8_9ROSI